MKVPKKKITAKRLLRCFICTRKSKLTRHKTVLKCFCSFVMNVQQQAVTAHSYTFLFRTLLMLIFSYFYKNVPRNTLAESWQSITPLCFYGRVVIDAHADSKINVQAAFSAATKGTRNENFNQVSCYKVLIPCESLMLVLSFLFFTPLAHQMSACYYKTTQSI